ncbi:unnamed protein product, partial [Iphiclides podalirius]
MEGSKGSNKTPSWTSCCFSSFGGPTQWVARVEVSKVHVLFDLDTHAIPVDCKRTPCWTWLNPPSRPVGKTNAHQWSWFYNLVSEIFSHTNFHVFRGRSSTELCKTLDLED